MIIYIRLKEKKNTFTFQFAAKIFSQLYQDMYEFEVFISF